MSLTTTFGVLMLVLCFCVAESFQSSDPLLVLALKHQNIDVAQNLLENEIANPNHPNYGLYLTQEEIRDIVQPAKETQRYIKEYIRELDAYDITVTPTNDWISCKVPVRNVEKLRKDEAAFNNYASPLNSHLDIYRAIVTMPSMHLKTTSENVFDVSTHNEDDLINKDSIDIHFTYFRTSPNSVNFVVIPQSQQKDISTLIIGSSTAQTHSIVHEVEFSPLKEDGKFECSKCSMINNERVRSKYCPNHSRDIKLCISEDLSLDDLLPFSKLMSRKNVLVDFYVKVQFDDETSTGKVTLNNDNKNSNLISVLFESDQMDPNTQRSIYGTTAVGTGNTSYTQMIWGTGSYGYSQSDLGSFYSEFNVDSLVSYVTDQGQAGNPQGSNWVEATLDTQYISAIGPQIYTVCSNTDNNTNAEASTGFGDALLLFSMGISNDPTPPLVISMSLGSLSWDSCNLLCTQASAMGVATYDYCLSFAQSQYQVCMYSSRDQVVRISNEFSLMGLRGITIFAAAGDGGNHFSFGAFVAIGENRTLAETLNEISCNYSMPTFPASSPYVVGVGGLQMEPASGGGYYPIGCSSQTGGDITGGCGFSYIFPMPSYQQSFVESYLNSIPSTVDLGYFNKSGRAYPDLSGISSNVPIVVNGKTEAVYGTSCSTPEVAGLFSLINEARFAQGLPSLGFVNPLLYSKASSFASSMFVDAIQGNSACGTDKCCDNGFPATPGWDVFTGWGNPNFSGLVSAFTNL